MKVIKCFPQWIILSLEVWLCLEQNFNFTILALNSPAIIHGMEDRTLFIPPHSPCPLPGCLVINETIFECHSNWEVLLAFSALAGSTHEKYRIRGNVDYMRWKRYQKLGVRHMENLKTNRTYSNSLAKRLRKACYNGLGVGGGAICLYRWISLMTQQNIFWSWAGSLWTTSSPMLSIRQVLFPHS